MFERMTDGAKQAVTFAREEALAFNHDHIGTQHVLLGLLRVRRAVAASVLGKLRLDAERIRLEVERIIVTGPETVAMAQLPFTPRLKRVFELATRHADRLEDEHIGTEHILLGLIEEPEGVAAQVLNNLGVDHENVRKTLFES